MSMLSAIAYDALPRVEGLAMGVNYGFDKVRFVAPVRAGARIRGRFKLESLAQRSPTEFQAINAVTLEIEGLDKPALTAQWLSLFVLAPAAAALAGDVT
jgi:acyl dehydratase